MKKVLLLLSMIVLASCSNDDQETASPQSKAQAQDELTTTHQVTINPISNPTGKYYVNGVLNATFETYDGLYSPNGRYVMYMESNGLLFIKDNAIGVAKTFTFTTNSARGAVAKFQSDGNLVIYSQGRAVWASGTNGYYNAILKMQDDGNLVIYWAGMAKWSSRYNGTPRVF